MDAKELELVKRLQNGDEAAEAELVKNYEAAVRMKIYHDVYENPGWHRDIAQEVLRTLVESLRQLDFLPEQYASLAAYVRGVTRNKINEWRRRHNLEKRHFAHSEPLENYMANEATAEQIVLEQETKREIEEVLRQLPGQHRRILQLYYLDGLPVHEISRSESILAAEVSAKKNYALKLARKIYQKRKK